MCLNCFQDGTIFCFRFVINFFFLLLFCYHPPLFSGLVAQNNSITCLGMLMSLQIIHYIDLTLALTVVNDHTRKAWAWLGLKKVPCPVRHLYKQICFSMQKVMRLGWLLQTGSGEQCGALASYFGGGINYIYIASRHDDNSWNFYFSWI